MYTTGFYKGVMIAGPFAGQTVQEAKPKMKAKMCADGDAFVYLEPEGFVTPRSTPDIECVVALVDQWYLKYGTQDWATAVKAHVEGGEFETFNASVKKAFSDAIGWLGEWACSRSFGLGTRVPWDEKFLIESLSDSTIYMASTGRPPAAGRHAAEDVINGKAAGPAGVKPERYPAFWDYILLGKPYDGRSAWRGTMKKLRTEFAFCGTQSTSASPART